MKEPSVTIAELKNQLEANLKVILHLCEGASDKQMQFKPTEGRWSLLEVINHLADEECEDFRACLSNMMENPAMDWPDIRPLDWVESRMYGKRDPAESISRFRTERENSLAWLGRIPEPDLSAAHTGKSKVEPQMHVGDIVASWAAHDYFHIRQMTNLKWEYLMKTAKPYSCRYAGEYEEGKVSASLTR